MDFSTLIDDKSLKSKQKTEALCAWLLSNPEKIDNLIGFALNSKGTAKATCIEAIEFATKKEPGVASSSCLQFVSKTLLEKSPRVKWESAKVIGNIAHLFPSELKEAIKNLLLNSENNGTVVRWSAAFALGQILKIKPGLNKALIPIIESICEREEKHSIRKIYLDALNKMTI
ncbi:MAG: HEAT repeat domain-containing protein [Chitinophagaceae bacterium]|nr:HEAT repeat domain-containing protein [Chitinophagaceae bacterium]